MLKFEKRLLPETMWSYRAWRRNRILRKHGLPEHVWRHAFAGAPVLEGLTANERLRLRELATLFLHGKSVEATRGVRLDVPASALLALQSCLPILNLGLEWYRGWYSLIVYPGTFVAKHTEMDEAGVVHHVETPLAGESWERGPVIVAWDDIERGGLRDGRNLLIHELAHKLDALDGVANGFPPLHRSMDAPLWTATFSAAYQQLLEQLNRHEKVAIDPYAAEAPEEFFAVASEYFFELPDTLSGAYPEVYERLKEFYRQDPRQRIAASSTPAI